MSIYNQLKLWKLDKREQEKTISTIDNDGR